MSHCTGMLGRLCSCGMWHGDGGRQVDTNRDEAPRARMPITLAEDDGLLTQDTSGLFTSRAFWIGGAISILLWTALVLVLHYR